MNAQLRNGPLRLFQCLTLDFLRYGEPLAFYLNPVVLGLKMFDLGLLSGKAALQYLDLLRLLVQNNQSVFQFLTVERLCLCACFVLFSEAEKQTDKPGPARSGFLRVIGTGAGLVPPNQGPVIDKLQQR